MITITTATKHDIQFTYMQISRDFQTFLAYQQFAPK